ncbi:hypothetical protein DFH09DRAFT_1087940 [Mycena vulgaris]|nr:hypothetical protein DFH09DRAFT_1087940 [Mycena vulgaris]
MNKRPDKWRIACRGTTCGLQIGGVESLCCAGRARRQRVGGGVRNRVGSQYKAQGGHVNVARNREGIVAREGRGGYCPALKAEQTAPKWEEGEDGVKIQRE